MARWKNSHRVPGTMNKLEAAYSEYLAARKRAGEIVDYRFEPLKFRLADNTTITPDFIVLVADGFIEAHDCKGSFFPEHNRVKWKVAIDQYPWFTWVLVRQKLKRDGGGFTFERYE